jgi:hypothetical protein
LKAVVVETKKEYAIALSERGTFIRVNNDGIMQVGHEVDVPGRICNKMARIISIAAMLVLVIGLGCGAYLYNIPYSYVDIDINPSMELTVNIFDRIIGAEGFNVEGSEIVGSLQLVNRSLEDGVRMVVSEARVREYIRENYSNVVLFTVVSRNEQKAEILSSRLLESAAPEIADDEASSLMVQKVEIEKYEKSKDNNISPGKKVIIEKVIENNPEVEPEALENAPIGEIIRNYGRSIDITENKDRAPTDNGGKDNNSSTVLVSGHGKERPGEEKDKEDNKDKGNNENKRKSAGKEDKNNDKANKNSDKENGNNSKRSWNNSKESKNGSKENGNNSNGSWNNSKESKNGSKENGNNSKRSWNNSKESKNGSKENGNNSNGSWNNSKESKNGSKENGNNSNGLWNNGKESNNNSKENRGNNRGNEDNENKDNTENNKKSAGKENKNNSKGNRKNDRENRSNGKEDGDSNGKNKGDKSNSEGIGNKSNFVNKENSGMNSKIEVTGIIFNGSHAATYLTRTTTIKQEIINNRDTERENNSNKEVGSYKTGNNKNSKDGDNIIDKNGNGNSNNKKDSGRNGNSNNKKDSGSNGNKIKSLKRQ